MKHLVGISGRAVLLSLFTLVFSEVSSAQTAQIKTMDKQDLAAHGFEMLVPGEAGFAEALKAHGFAEAPSLKAIVVKNNSKKGIAAFGIQYLARCADSTELPVSQVIYTAPQALLDVGQVGKRTEPIIEAGGSRVISPSGIEPSPTHVFLEMVPSCPVVGITAKADVVVYEDGRAYGPDKMKVLDQLRTDLAAQQDLVLEISGRMAEGEEFAPVLADISARLPSRDFHAPLILEEETLYVKFRRHYVRLLSSEQRRSGDTGAVNKLRHYAFGEAGDRRDVHHISKHGRAGKHSGFPRISQPVKSRSFAPLRMTSESTCHSRERRRGKENTGSLDCARDDNSGVGAGCEVATVERAKTGAMARSR
jgi:hypothetical protein